MNEKLFEFAKHAGFYELFEGELTSPYTEEADVSNLLAAFAELIIRECADQCTTNGPFTAETVWGTQFRKKIMDNFGVNHQGMHQCVPQTARPSESELQTQRTIC